MSVKVKNMQIEVVDSHKNTINIISSSLALNWSREDANIECSVSNSSSKQYAFRYTTTEEDIVIWFKEHNNYLTTTNVVPRHVNEISIDKCNNMIELFAEKNLMGKVLYSIF